MAQEFKLPELGENVSSGDLVRVMVKPGDTVNEGQAVIELETDKAVIEVPSSVSGKVQEVKVQEGQKLKVGTTIFTYGDGNGTSAPPAKPEKKEDKPKVEAEAGSRKTSCSAPSPRKLWVPHPRPKDRVDRLQRQHSPRLPRKRHKPRPPSRLPRRMPARRSSSNSRSWARTSTAANSFGSSRSRARA